jgi:hypothetical protein
MVTRQYRAAGIQNWQSQMGNALIAIFNKSTSDRRLIVNSLEIYSNAIANSGGFTKFVIGRSTTDGGRAISLTALDSEASLPSGIEVRKESSSTISSNINQITWFKVFAQASSSLPQRWGSAIRISDSVNLCLGDGDVEAIVVRAGESVAVTVGTGSTTNQILRVSGTIVVNGSPNRTFMFSTEVFSRGIGTDIISFVNNSASDVFKIKKINIQELGTLDTPYLQVVPIGSIPSDNLSDTVKYLTVAPMDSDYGAFDTTKCLVLVDSPIFPYGVPFSYIADASALSPKGYNYLHTKDFIGPSFFTCFAEFNKYNSAAAVDSRLVGSSNAVCSIVSRFSPIVLRPGEGLAIVSAAETASVTTAIGTSGWMQSDFGITISTKPLYDPTIDFSGLISGSDIVILEAGTDTELLNVDANAGSTYSWAYDPDITASIDICIYKAGYIPYIIRNYSPGDSGGSIIVAQSIDRAYLNP